MYIEINLKVPADGTSYPMAARCPDFRISSDNKQTDVTKFTITYWNNQQYFS